MSAAPPLPSPAPAWIDDLLREAAAAREAGRHALALAILRRVAAAAPGRAHVLQHLGALLVMLGRPLEAEPVLREALAREPGDAAARHALAAALMAQGRYAEAWKDYEARFQLPELGLAKPVGFPYPEWRGEDLAGKRLVVFPEMGPGEQIQHARFAPLLRDRGAEVILLCRPQLVRLFADSLPGVQVVAARGRLDFPDPDYWTMSASLAGLSGVTPETLPAGPYLRAQAPGGPRSAGFEVGLLAADPDSPGAAGRAPPPDLAEQLRASLPGRVTDLAPAATGDPDLAELAAIVAGLDLVVTVDAVVAHLAGALGKPGFVLLPSVGADWRWPPGREASPWYPSLRLCRADAKAGWAPALERLARDARAMAR